MNNQIAAIVTSALVLSAGVTSAEAAIYLAESGTVPASGGTYNAEPGRYRFNLSASAPVRLEVNGYVDWYYNYHNPKFGGDVGLEGPSFENDEASNHIVGEIILPHDHVDYGEFGWRTFHYENHQFSYEILGPAGTQYNLEITFRAMPPGPVPEPTTWGLMILGFAASGVALRRRRAAGPSPDSNAAIVGPG